MTAEAANPKLASADLPKAALTSWQAGGLVIALHAIGATTLVLVPEGSSADRVLSIAFALTLAGTVFAWASLDARRRGTGLHPLQALAFVFVSWLAVPVYLARHRPAGSWPRWLGKGVVILLASFATVFIATFAVAAEA